MDTQVVQGEDQGLAQLQPLIDRLTLRLFNLKQFTVTDFSTGKKGCRLQPESLKAYLARYEAELESKTSGEGTPTFRQVIRQQITCLKEMVMKGNVGSFYGWKG